MDLKTIKQYIRVDYTDDDNIIELMLDVVMDERTVRSQRQDL